MSVLPAPGSRSDTSSRGRAALRVALIAYGLVTMTICLPSMQEWGAILEASPGAVQLTFSAYVLAYGALQLVYAPLSYVFGNFLTSRLAHHGRDMRMRAVGQALTLAGIVTMIVLALLDLRSGLAFTGPLVLFGIGLGLLMAAFTLGAIAAQAMLPRGRSQ
jgi:DHA1 family bicyclomycin/chloramphenicol resistance-like MFS transporter